MAKPNKKLFSRHQRNAPNYSCEESAVAVTSCHLIEQLFPVSVLCKSNVHPLYCFMPIVEIAHEVPPSMHPSQITRWMKVYILETFVHC